MAPQVSSMHDSDNEQACSENSKHEKYVQHYADLAILAS